MHLNDRVVRLAIHKKHASPRIRSRVTSGFTFVETMVVFTVLMVLIGLILPAVQHAREIARKTQCLTNLSQYGLALYQYESLYRVLPPGSVDNARPVEEVEGRYLIGWKVQILPMLDQSTIYKTIDFKKGIAGAEIPSGAFSLRCPSSNSGDYLGCHHDQEAPIDVDQNGVLFLNSKVKFRDISDGLSNTIFVGEGTPGPRGWMWGTRSSLRNTGSFEPPTSILAPLPSPDAKPKSPLWVGGFSTHHTTGSQFLMGDGSIRFIYHTIEPEIFRGLGNRHDSGPPDEFE